MAHNRKGQRGGFIIANLTRGTFDGIYAEPAHLTESIAAWRSAFPGDLIVTVELVDWPDAPFDQSFAHKVRWMSGGA